MFTKHSEHFLFSKWPFYLQLPGYVLFFFNTVRLCRGRMARYVVQRLPLPPLVGTISQADVERWSW